MQSKIAPHIVLLNIYYKFNALQTGIAIAIQVARKHLGPYIKSPGGHNEKNRHDA
jgi:hypothetical protein